MCEITGLDHFGRGITRKNGKIIFVNNALPGEKVDIEIILDKKNYSVANVKNLKESSLSRRNVKCPYYHECGGCDIMHMKYSAQVKFKKEKVKNILKKYASLDVEPDFIESDKEFNYRNKVVLHKKNQYYGFYKKNTHDLVYINECLLLNDELNNVIKKAQDKEEVIFRNCDNYVIGNTFEKSEGLKTINGLKFKLNINSFFQVNDFICSRLFDIVSQFVTKEDIVLDLYAGVGTLSIVAGTKASKVYSVEINEYASMNARENIKINNSNNIEVINGDVSKILSNFNKQFNAIIVDPPRSGLDKNTKEFILDKKPAKVLYIACDPVTLARDLKELSDVYDVNKVILLDMFPNTYHVETVCLLSRKDK